MRSITEAQMAKALIKFTECMILRNGKIYRDDVWVRNGKIIDPQPVFFGERKMPDHIVDCKGMLLVPGFIEVQLNGAFGLDFSYDTDNIKSNIETVAKKLLPHGVTSFCPTLVTSPPSVYHKVIHQTARTPGGSHGAGILGLHIEGPFINKKKRGAHPADLVLDQSPLSIELLESVYGSKFWEHTSILTLAPEIANSSDCIKKLTDLGITVSIGHSEGTLKDGEIAFKAGARFITHLFNAMLPFHHRDPGLVGLLTSNKVPSKSPIAKDHVYYGLIADGIHTHPATMRIAQRTNQTGCVLVSDAIAAAGLKPGTYRLGQQAIEVSSKRAVIAGTNTLCGSIALLDKCVQIYYEATECTKVDAIEAATLHPALLLGIERTKGTLAYGSDADFVLLDEDLEVMSTYIAGECVWDQYPVCAKRRNSSISELNETL